MNKLNLGLELTVSCGAVKSIILKNHTMHLKFSCKAAFSAERLCITYAVIRLYI